MSKTIKTSFNSQLTFIKFIEAHNRAKEGKGKNPEIIRFEINLESNILNLIYKIKTKQYRIGKYHEFYVFEPKMRLIKSLPYQDRVVHQWYVEEFIKPFFVPRFITHTYACLENKGAHKAVIVLQKWLRCMKKKYQNYYILKCDIRKYFYSINKEILFQILSKRMKDTDLIFLTKLMVFDEKDLKGIPIGNYTSQYFANIYLNELDHFVKEELHIPFYMRYMDDFILLVKTKEEAKEYKERIARFLKEHLDLELNEKSRYYPSKMGVDFCGYRIFETHILLRRRSKNKIKGLIKSWNQFYNEDVLNFEKVLQRWNSWRGHAKHANSYNLRKKYLNKIEFKERLEMQ